MYRDNSGSWVCLSVGPSALDEHIGQYYHEACSSGILSRPHRSPQFSQLYERLVFAFQRNQLLPKDYAVLLFSSATECWQVIADTFIESPAVHVFNGSFGEKWWKQTQSIKPKLTRKFHFEVDEIPSPASVSCSAGLLCLTQTETSNGSAVPIEEIARWRNTHPDVILAIDATSSMGGVQLPWSCADIWFASVQKCFGLPPGLSVMLLSQRAVKAANNTTANYRYNLINNALKHYNNFQTTHTPNTANIYLLTRVLEERASIQMIAERTRLRADDFFELLETHLALQPLVQLNQARSQTIITIETKNPIQWINQLADSGIVVSSGYGLWRQNTFRIANFPAIKTEWINDFIRQIN